MDIKVHWIIDGIANVEAETLEDAERIINEKLTGIVKNTKVFSEELGATSIQGKAYFPGKEE